MNSLDHIHSSRMFASNTSSVDVLPQFLIDMDQKEATYIDRDRLKRNAQEKMGTAGKVGSILTSIFGGATGGTIAAGTAGTALFGPVLLGVSLGALVIGSITTATIMLSNHAKAIDETSDDRLVRLKDKIRVIDLRLDDLSENDKLTTMKVRDYFETTVVRFLNYRDRLVIRHNHLN